MTKVKQFYDWLQLVTVEANPSIFFDWLITPAAFTLSWFVVPTVDRL